MHGRKNGAIAIWAEFAALQLLFFARIYINFQVPYNFWDGKNIFLLTTQFHWIKMVPLFIVSRSCWVKCSWRMKKKSNHRKRFFFVWWRVWEAFLTRAITRKRTKNKNICIRIIFSSFTALCSLFWSIVGNSQLDCEFIGAFLPFLKLYYLLIHEKNFSAHHEEFLLEDIPLNIWKIVVKLCRSYEIYSIFAQ